MKFEQALHRIPRTLPMTIHTARTQRYKYAFVLSKLQDRLQGQNGPYWPVRCETNSILLFRIFEVNQKPFSGNHDGHGVQVSLGLRRR